MEWENLLIDQRFHTPSPPADFDGRNPFENDYSRIVSSPSIRRLQDKTQVFPLQQSDFIRTRLTHSMEVSSIAGSIGKSVEQELMKHNKYPRDMTGRLPSLLFTCGLIHDLGNPPYGHFGETAFQNFFKKYFRENNSALSTIEKADFENFDGNVQTFRILRKLSFLGTEYSYNLTFPTLATIIKYPCDSTTGNKRDSKDITLKKFGYYQTEKSDYEKISDTLGLNGRRHPATFLLEAADDIAYSAADIEDGMKLGCLNYETVHNIFKNISDKHGDEPAKELLSALEDFKRKSEAMPSEVGSGYVISKFRIYAQVSMIKSVIHRFIEKHDDIISGNYGKELLADSPIVNVREGFKDLSKIVFDSQSVLQAEMAGYEILTGLLQKMVDASSSPNFAENGKGLEAKIYKVISKSLRYIYTEYPSNACEEYRKLQLIVDFVSGMTDNYALNYYHSLNGVNY